MGINQPWTRNVFNAQRGRETWNEKKFSRILDGVTRMALMRASKWAPTWYVSTRVVSNSNAIRAHSHSHPWLDLERRESIRECELNGTVLTNPMNPHSAQWIGIHNVAHSKINSNVNSKLNWVECVSVDSTLNWTHPCSVLFAPPTSLQRVVCVMNQIHWV